MSGDECRGSVRGCQNEGAWSKARVSCVDEASRSSLPSVLMSLLDTLVGGDGSDLADVRTVRLCEPAYPKGQRRDAMNELTAGGAKPVLRS